MGASLGYLSTLLSLFKTLFDSPQIMVTRVIEDQAKEKSEKKELIRTMSSVFNKHAEEQDFHDEEDFPMVDGFMKVSGTKTSSSTSIKLGKSSELFKNTLNFHKPNIGKNRFKINLKPTQN